MYYVEQTDPRFAPRGREGGEPGQPGSATVTRAGTDTPERVPGKGYIHLYRGDLLSWWERVAEDLAGQTAKEDT